MLGKDFIIFFPDRQEKSHSTTKSLRFSYTKFFFQAKNSKIYFLKNIPILLNRSLFYILASILLIGAGGKKAKPDRSLGPLQASSSCLSFLSPFPPFPSSFFSFPSFSYKLHHSPALCFLSSTLQRESVLF